MSAQERLAESLAAAPVHHAPYDYACYRPESSVRSYDGRCRACVVAAFAAVMTGDDELYVTENAVTGEIIRQPLSRFVRRATERYGFGLPLDRLPVSS